MKRVQLFLAVIWACCLPLLAQNEHVRRAAELYAAQSYDEAAQLYAQIVENEGVSPELYYNYANACYKSNKIGLAVLNYERALVLRPNYEDARFNLEFVNQQIVDRIEPVQPFFLSEWLSALGRALTSNGWAVLSITLFAFFLLFALIYVFGKWRWLRKTAFFSALLAFVISVCAMAYAFSERNRLQERSEAIVMVGSMVVKSAPDDSGTELFVLHEGTKVSIKSMLNAQWAEIRIADGHVGWVKMADIERI